ncbi:hypothetical protein GWI33_012190 [Rhynchophorus ferrugineus]|uniref:Uncharacterized protein n=1 Tax=Rhynchophorus ferrugineus TaxID=354439 RepID=A0A834I6W6_RHYFE|nr:hypothetical protein GWI33_012190 [Rhynchophorus ferrugineus]
MCNGAQKDARQIICDLSRHLYYIKLLSDLCENRLVNRKPNILIPNQLSWKLNKHIHRIYNKEDKYNKTRMWTAISICKSSSINS